MIDLSLSEVARGKVMVAAKNGQPIPPGWALDANGEPTTDAQAALKGSMLPIGAVSSPKGAMLALVVELLVTAVIGANYGFEASSFFVDEGNQPGIGQTFLVIDPGALAGSEAYLDRLEVLRSVSVCGEMAGDVALTGAALFSMARDARWKLVHILDSERGQLFDLETDPGEERNLWDEPSCAGQKARLLQALLDWRMRSSVQTMHVMAQAR